MIQSVPFTSVPGFSRLFCDFLAGNEALLRRFPANVATNSAILHQRAEQFSGRESLPAAIRATMSGLPLSAAQQRSLEILGSGNGLAIVTGQQVGFLGGATYTVLKLVSAVRLAEHFTASHTGLDFAPVFWVEDNDNDTDEAAETTILSAHGEPMRISCAEGETHGMPVSELRFGRGITAVLEEIRAALPQSENAANLLQMLEEIYRPGVGWTDAFVRLLNTEFAETGVVFLAASELRRRGLGADILRREAQQAGETATLMDAASNQLLADGYHAQARGSEINLFYHRPDGRRVKIHASDADYSTGESRWTSKELRRELEVNPERFSPNVALRPLVQDSVVPTACYVGGPGEIAYLAQLSEVYQAFGVAMPAVAARHSATILTPAAARFLAKSGQNPAYFFRPWNEIDRDLAAAVRPAGFDDAISGIENGLRSAFGELTRVAAAADSTLVGATEAALNNALKSVEVVQKKAVAALKRKNEADFAKVKIAANLILPAGGLQERTFATFWWRGLAPAAVFHSVLGQITGLPVAKHYFFPLFP